MSQDLGFAVSVKGSLDLVTFLRQAIMHQESNLTWILMGPRMVTS